MPERPGIFLIHGIARFDEARARLSTWLRGRWTGRWTSRWDAGLQYFRGIETCLTDQGYRVGQAHLAFAAASEIRAGQLAEQIRAFLETMGPGGSILLIAHSMGGLDARRALVQDTALAARVKALATIGTPHLGTAVASQGFEKLGANWLEELRPVLDLTGFKDLTPEACSQFNRKAEAMEAANGVAYHVVSSWRDPETVFWPLRPTGRLLLSCEGPNDSLVSVRSQQWTASLQGTDGATKPVHRHALPFEADHLNQLAWWHAGGSVSPGRWLGAVREAPRFTARMRDFYLSLARELCGEVK